MVRAHTVLARVALVIYSVGLLVDHASAADPPRYMLKPGTELNYEGSMESKGTLNTTGSSKATAWVLRMNPDGSARVLIRSETKYVPKDEKREQPASVEVNAFDITPTGRTSNIANEYGPRASGVFPPLPDGPAETWQSEGGMGGQVNYHAAADGSADNVFKMTSDESGPTVDIYGAKMHAVLTIDRQQGLLTHAEGTQEQTFGFQTKGTSTTELKSVRPVEDAFIQSLAADTDLYFAATKRYSDSMTAAEKDATQFDIAKKDLETTLAELTTPTFREKIQASLKSHDAYIDEVKEQAASNAKIVDHPSPDWSVKDLAGKTHTPADYHGKVVVIDCWYRGCGWCIHAMPQINQIVSDFAGKPVAILGMNTDAKDEDAQFVADKMHLAYPTLRGPDVPAKYGVHGFPTLIIIDKAGMVRELHVGYSPTLRQDIGKSINRLLSQ
ncbi:MAG: thiol-disulfide isomerase-like thioredoxin [Phycisphaerales bacterium]|nr:thiol-disulfide isomerase-like thioredoxin [Phycisphaerales bacterium]